MMVVSYVAKNGVCLMVATVQKLPASAAATEPQGHGATTERSDMNLSSVHGYLWGVATPAGSDPGDVAERLALLRAGGLRPLEART